MKCVYFLCALKNQLLEGFVSNIPRFFTFKNVVSVLFTPNKGLTLCLPELSADFSQIQVDSENKM